jgi:uncharacterized protein
MKSAIAMLLLAGLMSCTESSDEDLPSRPASTVTFDDAATRLYVDLADTPAERRRGLMGVESLPDDQGMAFLFEEPTEATFWMKDTLIPLSIAFVGEDGAIVGIRDMQPCDAEPCPSYGVDRPFVLAIEANLGWFADHGIGPGDRADLRVSAYG